jgi:L-ascorbate metabolism protein UlaG (beta-lactamase superfamily)
MAEQHMNPAEAVQAHLDLGSKLSIATHFGCFQLTDEAIDDPIRDLAIALQQRNISSDSFRVPLPGKTISCRASAAN